MTTPDIAIEVEGLSKSFGGREVVRDLSMQVKRGAIYGFLGPNGSGKTTTIRMLCGLLTPDSGARHLPRLRHPHRDRQDQAHVGYMTQRFSLYQDLSVRENLEFVARVYGIADPAGAARAMRRAARPEGPRGAARRHAVGRLEAAARARRLHRCRTRSSCCSTSRPPASIPKARREFWDEIHALAAEGLTVLVSTHYMDEAERCHEIAYIAYGELLAHGTVEEVIAQSHLRTYVVSGDGPARLADEARAASPASTWWRRSAPACMSRAAMAARSKRRSRRIRARPAAGTGSVAALARGRVHRPDEPRAQDNFQ